MPDNNPPTFDEFSHRQANPIRDVPAVRQEVEKIVEKLLELEAQTHPQNKDSSEKELDSISALAWAEKLVEMLAGWAMDHRAGMILNGATVYPWPEDDQDAPTKANDHRHEASGSAYLKDQEPGDPLENRHIVAEITTRAALLPAALRNELSDAISALDFGEVRPLLLPLKGQDKNAYIIWHLRLRARLFSMGVGRKDKRSRILSRRR